MNDTPGWASPGSAPSDGQEPGASGLPSRRPTGPDRRSPRTSARPDRPAPARSGPRSSLRPPSGPPRPARRAPARPRHRHRPRPRLGRPGPPAPGGPGGYGPAATADTARPGGYPGWGGGWGGPPPAAKPGVIPLRPLGVGEILDGAVSTMRTHWRTVLGISLTVAVVTEIVVVLLQGLVLDDTASSDALNDPSATLDELSRAMGDTLLSSGVVFVISLIGTIIATALLTTVTSRAVLGKPVTTGEAWRDARPQLLEAVRPDLPAAAHRRR